MRITSFVLGFIGIAALFWIYSEVTKPLLGDYKETTPIFDVQDYFNGPMKAWGLIQDRRGRVIKRFDIQMHGHWDQESGTLEEHFTYYDGTQQDRKWTIKKIADRTYEGFASDIIGKAIGHTLGSAAKWHYVMELPVDGTIYHVHFDDWMWAMNDGVVINRTYLKKFGFRVAELTIVMQKQPSDDSPNSLE